MLVKWFVVLVLVVVLIIQQPLFSSPIYLGFLVTVPRPLSKIDFARRMVTSSKSPDASTMPIGSIRPIRRFRPNVGTKMKNYFIPKIAWKIDSECSQYLNRTLRRSTADPADSPDPPIPSRIGYKDEKIFYPQNCVKNRFWVFSVPESDSTSVYGRSGRFTRSADSESNWVQRWKNILSPKLREKSILSVLSTWIGLYVGLLPIRPIHPIRRFRVELSKKMKKYFIPKITWKIDSEWSRWLNRPPLRDTADPPDHRFEADLGPWVKKIIFSKFIEKSMLIGLRSWIDPYCMIQPIRPTPDSGLFWSRDEKNYFPKITWKFDIEWYRDFFRADGRWKLERVNKKKFGVFFKSCSLSVMSPTDLPSRQDLKKR